MFGVRTDNADDSVSLNNLTLVANGLYTGSYFHKSPPGKMYTTSNHGNPKRNYFRHGLQSDVPLPLM